MRLDQGLCLPSEGPAGRVRVQTHSCVTRGLEGCWPEAPPLLQHMGFYVEPRVAAGFSQDERSGDRVPTTAAAVPDLVGSPSPPLCTMW